MIVPTPTIRPSATPMTVPSITSLPAQSASISASVTPVKIGRLIFIKEGDIYQSDFQSYSLLVKNTIPAGDKLKWSPSGDLISWRPKSGEATPSSITIHNRKSAENKVIKPGISSTDEVMDYAWGNSDTELLVVLRNASYNLLYYNLATATPVFKNLLKRQTSINQIEALDNKKVFIRGIEGIQEVDLTSSQIRTIVSKPNIISMKLSPDKKKVAYSSGDIKKSELFFINTDGSLGVKIDPNAQIDLNNTGITRTSLNNGFSSNIVWFPSSDKLLIGFQYLPGLPLVGVYEMGTGVFKALTPMTLHTEDLMIDNEKLLGARVSGQSGSEEWRLSVFTMEDNSRLGVIRVFPGASSFSFFTKGNS